MKITFLRIVAALVIAGALIYVVSAIIAGREETKAAEQKALEAGERLGESIREGMRAEIEGNPAVTAAAPQSSPTGMRVTDPSRESIEYKLAYLDAGTMIDREDLTVKRTGYYLDRLVRATGESRKEIADWTVKAASVVQSHGLPLTNLGMLKEMDDFYFARGIRKMKIAYKDAVSMTAYLYEQSRK